MKLIAQVSFMLSAVCAIGTRAQNTRTHIANPEMVLTTGHAGLIQEIAFSQNGQLLLTKSSVDGTLIVWNTTTLQEYGRATNENPKLLEPFSTLRGEVYLKEPEGLVEYTLRQKKLSRRVVVPTLEKLPVQLPGGDLGNFAVSRNGQWLAYCRLDRSVHLLNLTTNSEVLVQGPMENTEIFRQVLFDWKSSRLLVWWPEGRLFVYAIQNAGVRMVLNQTPSIPNPTFAFDRSDNLWLAGFDPKEIDISSPSSKLLYAQVAPDRQGNNQIDVRSVTVGFVVSGVQFSGDARFLYVPGILGTSEDPWVDNVSPLGSLVKVLTPPTPPMSPGLMAAAPAATTISPDGSKIGTADFMGNIVLWDTSTHTSRTIPSGAITPVDGIALTASESFLVVGHARRNVDVWDLGRGLRSTSFKAEAGATSVGNNTDQAAFFDSKEELTILDLKANDYRKVGLRGNQTNELRFVDADKKVIWVDGVLTEHPTLKMWDLSQKGDVITLCHLPRVFEHPLAVSSSGRSFAAFCSSGTGLPPMEVVRRGIYVWKLPDLRPQLIDVEDKEEVPTLSPDGDYLVIGSTKELVDLRDGSRSAWTNDTIKRSPGTFPTAGAQFSRDSGSLFAFQGGDIVAWADWRSRARRETKVFSQTGSISGIALSKLGGIWLGKLDGTVSLVSRKEGREILRLFSILGAGWASVTPEGLFDGEADAIRWIGWKNPREVRVTPVDTFFDSFYHPGLLSEFARGLNPLPKGQTIGDLLDLPGLDYLVDLQLASFGYMDGSFGLCLAGAPTTDLLSNMDVTYKGAHQALSREEFKETDLSNCRNFKPLSGDIKQYEINARNRRTITERPSHPPRSAGAQRSDIRIHLQTITFNTYTGFNSLSFPSSDGAAFVKYFSNEAFVPEQQGGPVIKPWPALADTANLGDIRHRLAEIGENSDPQDIVLLFFSGHGTVLPGQQMYFFIPNTVKSNERDAIRLGSLNSAMLADAVRNMKARRILIVLDSCQSGGVLDSLRRVADSKVHTLQSQLAKEDDRLPEPGVAIIAAATPFQLAVEQTKVGYGFLAKALLDSLRSDSSDITDLSVNLEKHMDILTKNIREKQNPEILLAGSDFFLNSRAIAASAGASSVRVGRSLSAHFARRF